MSDIIFKTPGPSRVESGKAYAWYEKVVIPTYGTGKPEKNPVFLEKRVYQGSSGVVYPHPVIEKILDEKVNKEWNAVFLENQYLKIMILPELGGRIQMAWDKTKERHFVYYNQVIKPALVGLTGPWISGGIEFNWPQHHRPSTFEPVDHCIEENSDGSVTVWCSEVERMFRTRGMAGFTLYPGKAYLEINVKLYNRTDFPQTFLWWANPAVKVNDHYQSVFPPDVHAVYDHGKRDVSEFPMAKGTYYKVDYSPGTDISRYSNIPVPTSYMAVGSKYDFVGGYENDSKGGLLHIANHHVAPGKKQWTWGHGDFGRAWDRNLTDEDGPYIELMCGVYTDNQPDFSWLMPGEEKTFSQYFMPYRDLGVVKNATREALVNLETFDGKAVVKVFTTAAYPASSIILSTEDSVISEEKFDFHPATSFEKTITLYPGIAPGSLKVQVRTAEGRVLVEWQPDPASSKAIPEPAKPAKEPAETESVEQLYLTGLHLEQYRHATYDPREYYLEALRRDPGDSRSNNALGLWYLRRGSFETAEKYFRQAIATLTFRNPNPIDGEPFYNLGMALVYQDRNTEAFDAFYKSVWNSAWQENGYFQLARLAAKRKSWDEAIDLIDRALIKNRNNHRARHLKAALLRKIGRVADADNLISESISIDNFNFGILFEKYLLHPGDGRNSALFTSHIRGNIHTCIEYALDYGMAGLFDEAIQILQTCIAEQKEQQVYPLAWYYIAWFEFRKGDHIRCENSLRKAAEANPDYCFPNQPESVPVLTWASERNQKDYKAPYYLGNFWYNARNYNQAITCWEKSAGTFDGFPTVHRNLALAYFNKKNNAGRALSELEKAFALDPSDARILMELDQLCKRLNHEPAERLARLHKYPALVNDRDDLYLENIVLHNLAGRHEKALDMIMCRKFHPWEGGEGRVTGQYVLCLTELAKKAISEKDYTTATGLLTRALAYPENLGEGKLPGAQENEQLFWLGTALEGAGDKDKARYYWLKASEGMSEPAPAIFYNDQQPDTIFFQGLALQKLGLREKATERFTKLMNFGKDHLNDQVKIDYFAVSLPDLLIWEDDLELRNRQLCHYLTGLGYLGLGETDKALYQFDTVLKYDRSHKVNFLVKSKLLNP
jgi:tetratricopeptide (TPR) repeat protein